MRRTPTNNNRDHQRGSRDRRPVVRAAAVFLLPMTVWAALVSPAPCEDPPASKPDAADAASPASEPAEGPGEAADPTTPKIERLPDGRLRLGEITFDRERREIRMPTEVNMTEGLLEYALVHENGKVHESLLVTRASPFHLNVVMLLLGFRESHPLLNPTLAPERRVSPEDETPEQAARSRVDLRLEWQADGGVRKASLAAWLASLESGKPEPAAEGPWTYTGSLVSEGRFVAEVDGSIVAVYLDPNAMINNPREGNFNDDIWVPRKGVPEVGTPVTLVLAPLEPDPKKD